MKGIISPGNQRIFYGQADCSVRGEGGVGGVNRYGPFDRNISIVFFDNPPYRETVYFVVSQIFIYLVSRLLLY